MRSCSTSVQFWNMCWRYRSTHQPVLVYLHSCFSAPGFTFFSWWVRDSRFDTRSLWTRYQHHVCNGVTVAGYVRSFTCDYMWVIFVYVYVLFLETFPEKANLELRDLYEELFGESFWKMFNASSVPYVIRRAVYRCAVSAVRKLPGMQARFIWAVPETYL